MKQRERRVIKQQVTDRGLTDGGCNDTLTPGLFPGLGACIPSIRGVHA